MMAQRRHRNSNSFLLHVAAEVLELRSLLSAGASAVHAAVHHADVLAPATHSRPARVEFLATPYDISYQGTLSVTQVPETVGAHVHANFHFSTPSISISIAISGTISQVTTNQGPLIIVNLSQVKGSIISTFKTPGHHSTQKGTASDVVVYLNSNGSLNILTADFSAAVASGIPPLNGTFSFSPIV